MNYATTPGRWFDCVGSAMKRSPLVILFITVVIDLLGFGIILPQLPLYIDKYGGSPLMGGALAASYSVMQFIFAPIWGRASDIHGRRPFILLSLIGTSLSWLAFGFATSLWMLFAARIFSGVLTAASISTPQAYIADILPPEKRSRGMAMIGVAFGIGFAFGPWLGGFLGARYGLSGPAFFVAGLSFLNFLWSLASLPESHVTDREPDKARKVKIFDAKPFVRALKQPNLGALLVVFSVSTFAFALMEATFTWLILRRFVVPQMALNATPALIEKTASATAATIFGVVGITVTITQALVMGGALQRLKDATLVRWGSIMLAGSLLAIGLTTSLGWMHVAAASLAIGNGVMTPALSSLVAAAADPAERGGIFGIQQGLGSLARIVAPPLGTLLLQQYSTATPYIVSAILMIVTFGLALRLRIETSGSAHSSPAAH